MTAARLLFLVGFAGVLAGTIAVAVTVYAATVRATSHGSPRAELGARLRRLRRDRAEQATWAFIAHRVSGIGIFLFLALHIADVGLFAVSAPAYDEVHELFTTAPLRVFECALLFAILFHTFNGLRLLAVDLADAGPTGAARSLVVVAAATMLFGLVGSVVILAPVFS